MSNESAQTVAIAIQRGGVGKSFLTFVLASEFAARGEQVLMVDLDPQVSLSEMMGIDTTKTKTFDDLLSQVASPKAKEGDIDPVDPLAITDNLSILPASIDMAVTDQFIAALQFHRETCVKRCLEPYLGHFRWIFIDCSPSLGMLTINALTAAQRLVVPVGTDFVSVRALKHFISFAYDAVRHELNPSLELTGILPNRFDQRKTEATTCLGAIREEYEGAYTVFPAAKDLTAYSRAVAQRLPLRTTKNSLEWMDAVTSSLEEGRANG